MRIDSDLIYQLGRPYLRSSKLLTHWNQLGGSRLKPRTILGHGWVEHGNSQVIQSSIQRSYMQVSCLFWVFECACLSHWNSLQIYYLSVHILSTMFLNSYVIIQYNIWSKCASVYDYISNPMFIIVSCQKSLRVYKFIYKPYVFELILV